ncbi:hypothetical protein [Bacillus sp. 7894-2]|uniref:hypothetical protein n=1 Tax=Bacillus sp. 7894-2 TaxID=2021695 RepID=UPI00115511F6|nr:hypothetical protein [Bacillus sp. 7894-2]
MFDDVYDVSKTEQLQAVEALIEDWGHKERPKEIFVVLDEEDYEAYTANGRIDLYRKFHTSSYEKAIEELKEVNG